MNLPPPIQPQRLRRLDKLFVQSPRYFITFCTHDRAPLLAHEFVHLVFVSFCTKASEHDVWVGRYVVMPDHVHFFAALAETAPTLSGWIKSLKNTLSKSLREHGHSAPHWQKGFFDHVMRSAESYSEKWDYVRANPVRAGLVSNPDQWPYQGSLHDLRF